MLERREVWNLGDLAVRLHSAQGIVDALELGGASKVRGPGSMHRRESSYRIIDSGKEQHQEGDKEKQETYEFNPLKVSCRVF
ncbi:hypothetical protein A7U60_g1635 [Sanghuangporus baumii]|uniref:Uncharacterized protein n=1 Tax=Sanghuangporus baumii TaxID=108892 RepID=A0A9Q5I3M9_SANBA|nr:hypothetical protein A7U60_g1635 [Sanghuangporus baumii]